MTNTVGATLAALVAAATDLSRILDPNGLSAGEKILCHEILLYKEKIRIICLEEWKGHFSNAKPEKSRRRKRNCTVIYVHRVASNHRIDHLLMDPEEQGPTPCIEFIIL